MRYRLHVSVFAVLLSACAAEQKHVQKHVYVCFDIPLPVMRNPFPPRTQVQPTLFLNTDPIHRDQIDLTHIAPPPEFRVLHRAAVGMKGFDLVPFRWDPSFNCQMGDVEANGSVSFH